MKKFKLAIAMSMIGLLLFSGCSSNGAADSSTKKGPTKLVVIARGGNHVTAIDSAKAEFEKENNVKIQILGLSSDDLKKKISLNAKNKDGAYDLAMSDDPWIPEFAKNNVFEDLTKMGLKSDSDFIKQSSDLGKYPYAKGDIYALPFAGNVQFFFYNKALFQKYGYSVPTSWTDVLKIATEVKAKEGIPGYVIRGEQGNPILSDFLPVLWSYGGSIMDKNFKGTLDTKEGKEALKMYVSLYKAGANYNQNDIVTSVSTGKAAMSLGWPSWYISNSGSKAEYALIPNKVSDDSKSYSTGMIGNWMMGIPSNSKNKKLALKFLEYITSKNVQKKMADHGGVPTRTSVCSDEELIKKYPYLETLKNATENSVARSRTPKWSEIETQVGAELSSVVSGNKSIDDALKASDEDINKITSQN